MIVLGVVGLQGGDRSAYVETDGMGVTRTLSRIGGPAIDMRGHMLHVWLKVSEVTAATAIDVRVGDSGLANHFAFRLRSTQGQQWITDGEWVSLAVSWAPSNYAVVGTPSRGRITDISFRVQDDASGTRVRLAVNGLALVPEPVDSYPHGVVSFTFDDNYADMAEVAAPLLDAATFPATAYVIVEHVDRAGRTSLAQLRALHERGWDVAVHSFTSVNHDARFPTLDAALVEDELVDSRAWLMTHGFTGFDHCAYPGGDYTYGGETAVLPIVERYFTSCRTIYQRQREAFPPSHPHKLRVFYITSETSLATALAAVDHARAHREWIIFAFHSLVDTPPEVRTQWLRRDFAALVDHVVRCGMPVEPVSRVLAR
jgi:peptidoglycan/xylan/chitin deacetylase (PgdA/CDA1 family)